MHGKERKRLEEEYSKFALIIGEIDEEIEFEPFKFGASCSLHYYSCHQSSSLYKSSSSHLCQHASLLLLHQLFGVTVDTCAHGAVFTCQSRVCSVIYYFISFHFFFPLIWPPAMA
ncbi:hypothetical protein PIB30_049086 [Stylosanthes scabra]|uniref:Uncharacterized protein n=1 Tax=Stylosanthes scabra TaxID=79078 RepID=A0ABU6RHC5_9FABA|nr:hypothetical protein [Stylosanthes scabra]